MITYLRLTNFKRHESLELSFTEGLNLMRAANEAGKSSALQAIAYALYGARALPMSLAETVTYDKPEASLRVVLRFTANGSEFEIERHKNGAELRGEGVTASGQAEVTAFVDRLFNCSAAAANSLMFANQGALRGSLEGGSGAAVSLIEKLADVDALDRLVTRVQSELPTGNTKLIEARIAELAAQEAPVADFQEAEVAVTEAEGEVATSAQAVQAKEAALGRFNTQALQSDIAAAEQARKTLDTAQSAQARLNLAAEYAAPPLPDVEGLRQAEAEQTETLKRSAQHKKFSAFEQVQEPLYESNEAMQTHKRELTLSQIDLDEVLRNAARDLTRAEMSIIKEDLCGFCGKSFADIPEVIAKNAECAEAVTVAKTNLQDCELRRTLANTILAGIRQAEAQALAAERAMVGLPVEAFGGCPAKYRWVGGSVWPADTPALGYRAVIKKAEAEIETVRMMSAKAEAAQAELRLLDLDALTAQLQEAEAAEVSAKASLLELSGLQSEASGLRLELKSRQASLAQAQRTLHAAQAEFTAAQKVYEASQASLKQAEADLATYMLNNRVVKKIREARPLVAKQLWGVVLGSVSHYFSRIRGTQSIVTREGSGFQVDGRPVEGLSGSTLDALGLAIRIALTRTFLPTVPWLILDEPGAAADEAREAAMLGVVASCGFPQVLLVSHSDVGDAYAVNVIAF